MDAILPGSALKTFSKFLRCLKKVGDELYIEARPNKLQLFTLNSSKSVFAVFTFAPKFFDKYKVTGSMTPSSTSSTTTTTTTTTEPFVMCKVLLKPVHQIFQQKDSAQKSIDFCTLKIEHEGTEPKLIIQLHCLYGVLKTFRLNYAICQAVHAVYSKHQCAHQWTASSQILGDWLGYFHARQDEVTLQHSRALMTMKSFNERLDTMNQNVTLELQTTVSANSEDFERYEVQHDCSLTFNLKEFKAFLNFAETIEHPLTAYFDQGGLPIVFSVQAGDLFIGDLVLATVADSTHTTTLPHETSQECLTQRPVSQRHSTPREVTAINTTVSQGHPPLLLSAPGYDGYVDVNPPLHATPHATPLSAQYSTTSKRSQPIASGITSVSEYTSATSNSIGQYHDFPFHSSLQHSPLQHDIIAPKLGLSATSPRNIGVASPTAVLTNERSVLFDKVNSHHLSNDGSDSDDLVIPSTPPPPPKRTRRLF